MGGEFIRRKSSGWGKQTSQKSSTAKEKNWWEPEQKKKATDKEKWLEKKRNYKPQPVIPYAYLQEQQTSQNSEESSPIQEQQPNISLKSDESAIASKEETEEKVNLKSESETFPQDLDSDGKKQDLESQSIQTKLSVGKPGDKYEVQADATAASIMAMSDETLQRQTDQEDLTPDPSPRVERGEKHELGIQRKGKGENSKVAPSLESRLESSKGGGSPLPTNVSGFMEPRFGADFSDVRVHTDSMAIQMNQELGAQAFTHGNDIYYGSGKSPGNDELTAHELTHTIQQRGGKQLKPKLINKKQNKENKIQTSAQVGVIQRKEIDSSQAGARSSATAVEPQRLREQTHSQEILGIAKIVPPQSSPPQSPPGRSPRRNTSNSTGKPAKTPKVQGGEQRNIPAKSIGNTTGKLTPKPNKQSSQPRAQGKGVSSANNDPDFQAVVNKALDVASGEKQHERADKKAKDAQDAAHSPANEVESRAQGKQVGEMEKAPTPGFNPAAFKAKLMERIQQETPQTLEQADEFKQRNHLGGVRNEMESQVKQEQQASQTPLEQKAKQAPDPTGIKPKSVTPLPPTQTGAATENIGAQKAVPKPKGASEVELPLKATSESIDREMADAHVTEPQLANSNEPQFQAALSAKKQASANADIAPGEYRQFEQNQLSQAQTEAALTAQQQLQGMHGSRSQLLSQVVGQQVQTKGKDEQQRAKVASEIQKIYQQSKTKVETTLNSLDSRVQQVFDSGAAQAKHSFENYVDQRMKAYKQERYSGVVGKGRWLKDKLLGLPPVVNGFYQQGRRLYLQQMDGVLDRIVNIIATGLSNAKAHIANGRKTIQQYLAGLPQNLRALGQQAATDIQNQFDELEQSVDSKKDLLVDTLADKYNQNLQAIDSRIDQLKAANQGLVNKAFSAMTQVISTINNIKQMLLGVLGRANGAVGNILKNPVKFLSNLITGIKQGFQNFAGNIVTHLESGFVSWLTGTMAPMGIQIPDNVFSLPGVFSLVTQVLGLTYSNIRRKAVKRFGERTVLGMESSVEIFQVLREQGVMGLWEQLQAQFSDLKETVIEEIKNMLVTQVITAGVKWVLSLLNPASAFVRAAMAIYDIVMFFVNRGSQVLELVNAVVDAVAAIASGAVGGAAKLVENALARALPVAIGFFASLLGIGGLANRVERIIGRVRHRIDRAIDWILLKAQKMIGKTKGNYYRGWKSGEDEKQASPKRRKEAARNKFISLMKQKKSMSTKEMEDVFFKLKTEFLLSEVKLEGKPFNAKIGFYASPGIFLPVRALQPKSGQKSGAVAATSSSVKAGDYIKATHYEGPFPTPGKEVVDAFNTRFKGQNIWQSATSLGTPPKKKAKLATVNAIVPNKLPLYTQTNTNTYRRAGIVEAQSSVTRGTGRSGTGETIFGHFGADEERIKTGVNSTKYNGGHLVGDQIMNSHQAFNLYEDWNLAPQVRSFNSPVYTGTIENTVTKAINAGAIIKYTVQVQYPDDTYQIKPLQLIQNLLPSADPYRKDIEDVVKQNIGLNQPFTLKRRTPGFWQATAEVMGGGQTINSGNINNRQDVAFENNPANVQPNINYQPIAPEQVRYSLEIDWGSGAGFQAQVGPTPKNPITYTGATKVRETARQQTF